MRPAAVRQTFSEPKRHAIVAAAKQAFLRDGYGAGMDAIAAAAAVSKQTVYNHFGSKEELFKAVVDEVSAQLLAPLADPQHLGAEPRRALARIGQTYLRLLLAPETIALHRIIVAEAPRFPALARDIFASGPGRAVASLARSLAEADRRGVLRVPQPELSAEQFFGALAGLLRLRALMLVSTGIDEQSVTSAVEHAVTAFLRAHAPESAGRPL